jgi:hypothetical protein
MNVIINFFMFNYMRILTNIIFYIDKAKFLIKFFILYYSNIFNN